MAKSQFDSLPRGQKGTLAKWMNGNLAVTTQKCGGWANCVITHTMWPAMTAFSIDSQTLMLHFWSHYSPISRPLFGDKASQPFETRLSALRNIEINFAPVRHAGFANFRECHKTCVGLQKAKPVFTDCSCSDYCSQSSLCKPESTWFRFICRFS